MNYQYFSYGHQSDRLGAVWCRYHAILSILNHHLSAAGHHIDLSLGFGLATLLVPVSLCDKTEQRWRKSGVLTSSPAAFFLSREIRAAVL